MIFAAHFFKAVFIIIFYDEEILVATAHTAP
jgi:hypothetical protein